MRLAPLVHNGLSLQSIPPGIGVYRGWIFLEGSIGIDRVRASVYNAVVTCCSAAALFDLPLLPQDRDPHTHLAVPRNRAIHMSRSRRLDDVRIHRESKIDEDAARPWLADIGSVLERACQCVSLQSAVAMLDSARTQGLCDISELRIPERGPSVPSLRVAVSRSVSGSRSILETCARMQLEDAGISSRVAVVIPGVGEVDLVVFDCVVIELDGWRFHQSKEQREKDLARDRRLSALGYVVLRFDFDTVMNSNRFVTEVLAVRSHALTTSMSAGALR